MSKYVDAIGLKETFCAECNHTLKCEDCDIDYHFSHFPAADVRENVHGEWIPHIINEKNESIDLDVCSVCHQRFYQLSETGEQWNFCPNCGAYMRGES